MKVYVASSWKNPYQPEVVAYIRKLGFEVYDFRNPAVGDHGFSWSEIDPAYSSWGLDEYRAALESEPAKRGFEHDMKALNECDLCVLVMPCGTSSHLELGNAIGQGKRGVVLYPVGFTPIDYPHPTVDMTPAPELMVKMADAILASKDELSHYLILQARAEAADFVKNSGGRAP